MKKFRKILLTATAMLLVMSLLVACGSNNASKESPAANGGKTEGNGSSSSEPVTLNLFVDQPWWPFKDWSGDIPEEITKRTGIRLNVTVATDEKQLPIMLASGDLPDLVVTSTQYQQMSNSEAAYPWQELIDKYTPDFKIDHDRIAVNTVSDGNYYTIRNNFSTAEEWKQHEKYAFSNGAAIAVRSDLMEEMGNPEVKSLEDLDALFGQVKTKYPDMIPLVLTPTPTWAKGYFAQNFGAMISGLIEENGKMLYALNTQELKDMYLYMNQLYRKGYIKAENLAYKSEDQAKQLATTGKAFAYAWDTSGADRLTAATQQSGYSWEVLPIKISDNFKHERYDSGWQGVFITRNNKDPEASIKLVQFLMSDEGQKLAMWGQEGTDWNYDENGNYPVFQYNFTDEDIRLQKGVYYWGLLGGSAVTEQLAYFNPGTQTTKANQELSALTTFRPEIGMVRPDSDTEEQVISTNIENLIKNEESKVLLANSEEEAIKAYETIVEQANKIGMPILEAWANEKYEQVKELFE
ncbi:extracellular solute-binding protein [Paenibacillus fonticola]|uniref:extracellular solute-binding protein n=1 Tax=Paenibacillus fonticola TaxID=379896 RepID=UPI000372A07D|nr:extracellular solute-binding protein [Paenibacillus fonticola]